jgi:hypothetical protein
MDIDDSFRPLGRRETVAPMEGRRLIARRPPNVRIYHDFVHAPEERALADR